MNSFEIVYNSIISAKVPKDVFGTDSSQYNKIFHNLTVIIHPDKNSGPNSVKANEAIRKLNNLKDQLDGKVAPAPKAPPLVITIGKETYTVGELITSGDISDIYECNKDELVLKAVQHPSENDLLERENRVLKHLAGTNRPWVDKYIPKLLNSFILKGDKGIRRRVNVLNRYKEHYSLKYIIDKKKTLDYRDMAWMLKRTLECLTYVHENGYVHGAILPEHLLLHPIDHGLRLIDWCYSSKINEEHISAISSKYKDNYPPEVFKKMKVTPATDIYMVAKMFSGMLDGNEPKEIRSFFNSCLVVNKRPNDCYKLYCELNDTLQKLVGKPKYRKFEI